MGPILFGRSLKPPSDAILNSNTGSYFEKSWRIHRRDKPDVGSGYYVSDPGRFRPDGTKQYAAETVGDLDQAMRIYREILDDAQASRENRAEALFRPAGLEVPIVMMTGKSEELNIVLDPNLGANNRVTWLFCIKELLA